MDFSGKVAIVTGGAAGIGQATAREFAARKAAVAVVDRDVKAGHETAAEIRGKGGVAEFFSLDISQAGEVKKTIPQVVSRFGGIDILVNNAGIQRYGTATTTSEDVWDEVMNVNLKGAFLMSKYSIPEMLKRGGGAIVNTGSVQSRGALANAVAYVTSKHALLGLTRAMALDHARENIRVNCVCPGAIDTPMLRWSASLNPHPDKVLEACNHLHPVGRMGQAEEVARLIAFLASDLASFITGESVAVDGGLLIAIGGTSFQESGTGSGAQ